MVDEHVVTSIRRYLDALAAKGLPVQFAVLFGSHATGHARDWSDIDLLVVSPRFDAVPDRADSVLLWKTTYGLDTRIEPIPCGAKEWEQDESRLIVDVARREGIVIRPLDVAA